jgi:hypothetical protein
MAIEGALEAVLTIRFAVPPGQSPEDAGKQIHNAGAMIPLGLVRFVKNISVQIVPAEPTGPKIV